MFQARVQLIVCIFQHVSRIKVTTIEIGIGYQRQFHFDVAWVWNLCTLDIIPEIHLKIKFYTCHKLDAMIECKRTFELYSVLHRPVVPLDSVYETMTQRNFI